MHPVYRSGLILLALLVTSASGAAAQSDPLWPGQFAIFVLDVEHILIAGVVQGTDDRSPG